MRCPKYHPYSSQRWAKTIPVSSSVRIKTLWCSMRRVYSLKKGSKKSQCSKFSIPLKSSVANANWYIVNTNFFQKQYLIPDTVAKRKYLIPDKLFLFLLFSQKLILAVLRHQQYLILSAGKTLILCLPDATFQNGILWTHYCSSMEKRPGYPAGSAEKLRFLKVVYRQKLLL